MDRYGAVKTQDDFEEMHIDLVWTELRDRFGFNLPAWKKEFREYFNRQPRSMQPTEAFYTFGNASINEILNKILKRNYGHPTFNRLVTYVVRRGRK